jgi:Uma2 family endonuclease
MENAMVTLAVRTDSQEVIGPAQGRWSLGDWESLPDDGNCYEIINGTLYMSTSPSNFHQWISRHLDRHLGFPAEEQGLGFATTAPGGVIMPGCDPVQPDFAFVVKEHAHIIHDRRIFGVPDLIIEILSPSSISYDEKVKLLAYATAGVPEYAIIDPAKRTLRLYTLDAPGRYAGPREFDSTQTMSFTCLPGIRLEVGRLFEGAPDTTL